MYNLQITETERSRAEQLPDCVLAKIKNNNPRQHLKVILSLHICVP